MTSEQRTFFAANGYLMIEDAIEPDHLKHVQDRFLEGQDTCQLGNRWESRGFEDGGCTSFVPGKHRSIEDIPKVA